MITTVSHKAIVLGILILLFIIAVLLLNRSHGYQKTAPMVFLNKLMTSVKGSDSDLKLKWWEGEALIYGYMKKGPMYECKKSVLYGDGREGSWNVCHDEPFAPKPGCLALSFGIGNLWQFDDKMEKYGCEVFAFDPSMNKPDHKHSEKVWFYDLGVGGEDTDDFVPRKNSYVKKNVVWSLRTVKSILKKIQREKRIIDFLKIDVEGTEFDVLHNIIEDGTMSIVKQYLVEYHVFGDNKYKMGQYAEDMKKTLELGFRPFYVINKFALVGVKRPSYRWQADMGFVNTAFLETRQNSTTSDYK